MNDDLTCAIERCDRFPVRASSTYCMVHEQRFYKFGSASPMRSCYDCKNEFLWDGPAFRKKAYCNDCVELLIKYKDYVPDGSSGRCGVFHIRSHGITLVTSIKMLVRQDFKCALLGCNIEAKRRLAIDHDHRCCPGLYGCSKCVRGLVCGSCNFIIGKIEANQISISELSERLESYLAVVIEP